MKLKPCKCGAGKPKVTIVENIGVFSGDRGYMATAICQKYGSSIKRWALKKSWVKESAYKAWNEGVDKP